MGLWAGKNYSVLSGDAWEVDGTSERKHAKGDWALGRFWALTKILICHTWHRDREAHKTRRVLTILNHAVISSEQCAIRIMGLPHLEVTTGFQYDPLKERVLIMLVLKFSTNLIKWRLRMRFTFIKGNKDTVMSCTSELMVWDSYYYTTNDGVESLHQGLCDMQAALRWIIKFDGFKSIVEWTKLTVNKIYKIKNKNLDVL